MLLQSTELSPMEQLLEYLESQLLGKNQQMISLRQFNENIKIHRAGIEISSFERSLTV